MISLATRVIIKEKDMTLLVTSPLQADDQLDCVSGLHLDLITKIVY